MLRCLRVTAMPVRRMRRFAELVRAGDEALPERLELLRSHRRDVLDKLAELRLALEMIDHKIEVYAGLVAADGHPPVAAGWESPTGQGPAMAGRGGPARRA